MSGRVAHPNDTIAVAAAQMVAEPIERAAEAWQAIDRLIRRAADRRVELLVLPECAYPAYALGSPERYRAADVLSTQEYLARVAALARRRSLHIVTGYVEQDGDALFNSACVVDRHGQVLGTYRKQLLWDVDHDVFEPGDRLEPVETEMGRIGLLICADARVPEIPATLIAAGAQLIAMPTGWVCTGPTGESMRNPQPEFLIEARAREFRVPFVCANKAGRETEQVAFCGQSRIVRADGTTAAEAPPAGEALIVSRVVLQPPRRVWMIDSRRKQLLSDTPPAPTPETSERSVTVEVVPRVVIESVLAEEPAAYLSGLREHGVDLLVTNLAREAEAESLAQSAALHDLEVIAFPTTSRVRNLTAGTVGLVAEQASHSFASARALALEGAEIVCILTRSWDLATLRARALENRVYILVAARTKAAVIAPDGTVIKQCEPDRPNAIRATIQPALARDKTVAPRTNIFAARRPDVYQF